MFVVHVSLFELIGLGLILILIGGMIVVGMLEAREKRNRKDGAANDPWDR